MADETSIDVSKKSVADLLGSGSKSRFMIPEYQRPYAWGADQINTLFDDLTEYVKGDLDSEYFLGCVVTYRNGKEQEVIDGQQRLTTLFLLLRALYKKLEGMSDSKARTNLMNRIAPTLWRTDQITGEADRSSTLIESRAIDDDANATLKMILETGETDPNAKDPYSLNYRLLERRINDYAAEESQLPSAHRQVTGRCDCLADQSRLAGYGTHDLQHIERPWIEFVRRGHLQGEDV